MTRFGFVEYYFASTTYTEMRKNRSNCLSQLFLALQFPRNLQNSTSHGIITNLNLSYLSRSALCFEGENGSPKIMFRGSQLANKGTIGWRNTNPHLHPSFSSGVINFLCRPRLFLRSVNIDSLQSALDYVRGSVLLLQGRSLSELQDRSWKWRRSVCSRNMSYDSIQYQFERFYLRNVLTSFAASRSAKCAATIAHWPGSSPNSLHAERYIEGCGL